MMACNWIVAIICSSIFILLVHWRPSNGAPASSGKKIKADRVSDSSGGRKVRYDKRGAWKTHVSETAVVDEIQDELDELHGLTGDEIFALVMQYAESGDIGRTADLFRKAIFTGHLGEEEDLAILLQRFMDVHQRRKSVWLGLMLLAELYWAGHLKDDARKYVDLAIQSNQSCAECYVLRAEVSERDPDYAKRYDALRGDLEIAAQLGWNNAKLMKRIGDVLLDTLVYDKANEFFVRSFQLDSSRGNWRAAVSGIFARQQLALWGPDGRYYDEDARLAEYIIKEEIKTTYKRSDATQVSVFNPANVLPMRIDPKLKLAVARSHARGEQIQTKASQGYVEVNHTNKIPRIRREMQDPNFRIRIGYVSANINSRTTTFMAQNVLIFHDKTRFEVHVYATTPNDSPEMINVNMRGVNWRKKIQNSVEHFHEVVGINVVDLYNLILQHDIHILLNWDGFSNAGIRIGGIFSLSPAPIQINHQEYIGTMGADYIQYFISDNTTTPKRYRKYFSEKMILVPYTLLATSMAYLGPEMKPPSRTSSRPEMNGCHGSPSSFTYCNMNKHMKFTPDLFKEWVKILETVPNSVLCLLENPPQAQESIRDFLSRLNNSLQGRVRYSPFIVNPYDNLQRVKDQCNAVLDTPVYSGHTTNADALWGGVPVVTFGDSVDACGRVGQSMLTSLGLHDLIARNQSHYTEIAIRLAMNKTFYRAVRHQLVDTCLQTSPPHPYWDLRRYTAALETGFTMAFHRFVDGQIPRDIVITEEFEGISNIKTSGKVDPTRHVPIAFRASCSDRMDDVIRLSYSSDAYENKQKTTATINARPQKSSTSKNDKTAASDARPRSNKLKDVPYDQMDTSEASSERPESKRKGKKQHRTKRVKRKHSKKRTRPSNDEL